MEYISARQIVTRSRPDSSFYGYDFNMNIYKGCCHGCVYCDSRSDCYRIENFDRVRAKKNALDLIGRELRFRHKKGIVSTGAMSDPYNPFEKKYELTRGALELIDRYGFGVSVLTKSPLIARDADILQRIAHHSVVSAKMTVTCADDGLSRKLEPHVLPTSKRFSAIRVLADAGLFTGISVAPVLPFLTDGDNNIRELCRMTAEAGGKYVYLETGVTLRMNQRDYFYAALDRLYPGMKEEYIRAFGDKYHCTTPRHRELRRAHADECRKQGLLYKLPDILSAQSTPYEQSQLRLF